MPADATHTRPLRTVCPAIATKGHQLTAAGIVGREAKAAHLADMKESSEAVSSSCCRCPGGRVGCGCRSQC